MNRLEIFIGAVKLAYQAGWWRELFYKKPKTVIFRTDSISLMIIAEHSEGEDLANIPIFNYNYNYLLFNHIFAQHLWGDTLIYTGLFVKQDDKIIPEQVPVWVHALREMVLYSHPIDYIERNLKRKISQLEL